MMNMVRVAQNPGMMLQAIAQNNPQLKQVIDLVNKSGGDPRSAFYQMAKDRGVDPNQILNLLK